MSVSLTFEKAVAHSLSVGLSVGIVAFSGWLFRDQPPEDTARQQKTKIEEIIMAAAKDPHNRQLQKRAEEARKAQKNIAEREAYFAAADRAASESESKQEALMRIVVEQARRNRLREEENLKNGIPQVAPSSEAMAPYTPTPAEKRLMSDQRNADAAQANRALQAQKVASESPWLSKVADSILSLNAAVVMAMLTSSIGLLVGRMALIKLTGHGFAGNLFGLRTNEAKANAEVKRMAIETKGAAALLADAHANNGLPRPPSKAINSQIDAGKMAAEIPPKWLPLFGSDRVQEGTVYTVRVAMDQRAPLGMEVLVSTSMGFVPAPQTGLTPFNPNKYIKNPFAGLKSTGPATP